MIEKLIEKLNDKRVICPKPKNWEHIYKIICKYNTQNIEIPRPLILAGAAFTNDKEKFDRFVEQLVLAKKLGILPRIRNIIEFQLRRMPEMYVYYSDTKQTQNRQFFELKNIKLF